MIIVDTREKKLFCDCDSWPSSVEYTRIKLDFGDYQMKGGSVFIERKAIPDMIQSAGITKNWIRLQAEMQRFYDYRETADTNATMYIVIEGSQLDMADEIVKRKRRIQPGLIVKRLRQLRDTYGIEVIWADSREDACTITLTLLSN